MTLWIAVIYPARMFLLTCYHFIFITQLLDNYLQWTHAPTHNMYRMRIRNLYAVNRDGERDQFMFDIGNRFKLAYFFIVYWRTLHSSDFILGLFC